MKIIHTSQVLFLNNLIVLNYIVPYHSFFYCYKSLWILLKNEMDLKLNTTEWNLWQLQTTILLEKTWWLQRYTVYCHQYLNSAESVLSQVLKYGADALISWVVMVFQLYLLCEPITTLDSRQTHSSESHKLEFITFL